MEKDAKPQRIGYCQNDAANAQKYQATSRQPRLSDM